MLSVLAVFSPATTALAGALSGKTYIIEMSSSQMASGTAEYLVPPLAAELAKSGMTAKNGPGADLVANVVTASDVGQWIGEGEQRTWLYTISVTVGLSPGETVLPHDGTPVYGVRASLMTVNPDREDELACLISLAARTAIERYRPSGIIAIDGSSCGRR